MRQLSIEMRSVEMRTIINLTKLKAVLATDKQVKFANKRGVYLGLAQNIP